ncbi:MAG: undecaprenyl-phosphate galactose phosphotransferase WbaP [Candidatus Acidiferrales bacterium]
MSTITAAVRARPVAICLTNVRPATRPLLSAIIIVTSDIVAISAGFVATIWMRSLFPGRNYDPVIYLHLWPAIGLFLLAYLLMGLYPGVTVNPVRELKRLSSATTLVFLVLATAVFVAKEDALYSRAIFFVTWAITLISVPVVRSAVRESVCRRGWWGYSVVIFGTGPASLNIAKKLSDHPEHGLRPLAFVSEGNRVRAIGCMPVIEGPDAAAELSAHGVTHVIVAAAEFSSPEFKAVVHRYGSCFPQLLIAPELPSLSSLCLESRDICRMLMLQVQNGLLLRGPRIVKRLMDLLLSSALALIAAPVIGTLAILIKIDSPGPVFYGDRRIGRGALRFTAWKLRTMYVNAEEDLQKTLNDDPKLRAEWQRDHKLKHDPRMTRIGRFLRRSSFDELPQLWNVFCGEMSLVGPRPIGDQETMRYGEQFKLYCQVIPGLTGLWQVSGRNDLTYGERVELDTYYVRNWSPWLDIYVLAHTVRVVLTGQGAY